MVYRKEENMKKYVVIFLAAAALSLFTVGCPAPGGGGTSEYNFALDTTIDGSGSGSLDAGGSTTNGIYSEGTIVTASAVADTGNSFLGWYDAAAGGTLISTENPYTFNLNSNSSLYAKFIVFKMIPCPGGTFPTGTTDGEEATVDTFLIGETEVTYELWSAVRTWAENGTGGADGEGQYNLAHSGIMGDGTGDTNQHPVSTISWRDAIAWTNALTEWHNALNGTNYTCTYYTDAGYTTPIRTTTSSHTITDGDAGSQDAPYIKSDSTGFRLPTIDEWECAARYIGAIDPGYGIELPASSGIYWTPGGYASGATADTGNATATGAVAWYKLNSGSPISSQAVKGKTANQLLIYDICGNMHEWCWEWTTVGTFRANRGGSFTYSISYLRVGYINEYYPWGTSNDVGIRVVMND